jgi:CRISPR-associated protein Cmr2
VLRKIPCAEAFPFDAGIFLRSRWKSVFEERGLTGDPVSWGRKHVAPLFDELFEPYPYVACLMADGDHMGRAIERLADANSHRAFSRALSDFAAEARRIVEQEHLGSLVYAGGDDVLAFLPLPEALACTGRSGTASPA